MDFLLIHHFGPFLTDFYKTASRFVLTPQSVNEADLNVVASDWPAVPCLSSNDSWYRLQTGTLIGISNRDGCIDGDLNAMHQLFYLNIPYFIIYKVYFDSQTFLLCYFSCNEE